MLAFCGLGYWKKLEYLDETTNLVRETTTMLTSENEFGQTRVVPYTIQTFNDQVKETVKVD